MNENEQVPDESIFSNQFVEALSSSVADDNKDGFLTGTELGEFLQREVVRKSGGKQHPQYGKIRNPALDKGDFVFVVNSKLIVSSNSAKPSLGAIEQLETEGSISLNSDLSGKVFLDGISVTEISAGRSIDLLRVEAGRHDLRIEGEENWWGTVNIEPGKPISLNISKYWNQSIDFPFMKMIYVEGGSFLMGNNEDHQDQQPLHKVMLDDFEIGAFEVSVRQFKAFVKETNYVTDAERGTGENLIISGSNSLKRAPGLNWRFGPDGKVVKDLSQPVVFVSWNDAMVHLIKFSIVQLLFMMPLNLNGPMSWGSST